MRALLKSAPGLLRQAANASLWVLLAICTVGLALDAAIDDGLLLEMAESRVQSRFSSLVIDLEEQLALRGDSISAQSAGRPIVLTYSRNGRLLRWNNNRYVPDSQLARRLMTTPRFELLADRSRAYYVIKAPTDAEYRFCLVPLYESYPIRNEFLQNYFFLGGFEAWPSVAEAAGQFRFQRQTAEAGLRLRDLAGAELGTIVTYDAAPFRQHLRKIWLALAAAATALGAFRLYRLSRRRVPNKWRPWAWAAALLAARALLLLFSFPQSWADTELFSARLLAVNELAPSLGDLTLNALTGAALLALLLQRTPLGRVLRWLLRQGRWAAWLTWGLAAVSVLAQYLFFLSVCEWLGGSTKIYTEFNDLSRIDLYSLLLGFNLGLLLWGQFVLSFALVRLSVRLYRVGGYRSYEPALVAGAVFLMEQLLTGAELQTGLLLAGLYGVAQLTLALSTRCRVQFSFVQAVLLLGLFAILTNYALARSSELAMPQLMTRYVQKYRQDRDVVQEYSLEGVLTAVKRDTLLWDRDSLYESPRRVTDEVLSALLARHLQPALRGYDVVLSAFDTTGLRLDNQYEVVPVRADSSKRQPTLAQGFSRLESPDRLHRYLYLAQVDLRPKSGQRFRVQIELYPQTQGADRVYPRLLSETASGLSSALPTDFEMGVYSGGRLAYRVDRQWSAEASRGFPVIQPVIPDDEPRIYHRSEQHHELIERQDGSRAYFIRAQRRSLYQNLTSLSILFYFYFLLYLIYRLPDARRSLGKSQAIPWYQRLNYRIQLILLLLSLLPIAGVWLMTSSFFRQYFHQSARIDLLAHLQQVSQELQRSEKFLADVERQSVRDSADSRELLRRTSQLIGCDLNLYDLQGRLLYSTIPRIYHSALVSTYMEPRALEAYGEGWRGERVQTETIGRLGFLSGYLPLVHPKTDALAALLNIPYVAQQDLLSFQIERFFSYLINLYVLLFLIVLVVGTLITRTLTRPLDLLRAKMERTSYGQLDEPIDWASRDEIGQLISSYNQMLGKLIESEKRLAQNERELAWREMARQIAHEIKNPLTPMKLSIQHLNRILERLDSGDHRAAVQRISQTLLSQIDSLTAIASTFSQFATMPAETRSPLSLGTILQDIFNLYAEADEAELSIQLPDEDLRVLGDKNQVLRVLVNLVKNALQAMEKRGRIHLSLYQADGMAICKIADNGKGIPEEIQDKVFQPNFSTKTSGMGLGLAITRRIVEGMNGRIRFESHPGQGTTFYLEFPVYKGEG